MSGPLANLAVLRETASRRASSWDRSGARFRQTRTKYVVTTVTAESTAMYAWDAS